MDLLRIGDKLVSRRRIARSVDKILELRTAGHSQQEVADMLGIDRTFISRLETLGEVRKGGRIALIGFPIRNKAEVQAAAEAAGVEFLLLLSDKERWELVTDGSGAELFNRVLEWIAHLKEFDSVVFIASDMRIALAESVLGAETVVGMSLGPSPIKGDRTVDPEEVAALIRSLRV